MSLTINAQIDGSNPWYAGMHNPELQILFGKNSAIRSHDFKFHCHHQHKKTENPNYLFVTINTKDVAATEILFSFKNNNQVLFTHKYS
jgi:hypothetical protein